MYVCVSVCASVAVGLLVWFVCLVPGSVVVFVCCLRWFFVVFLLLGSLVSPC